VLLDAECAWWGDPAFDLASCLNHLLLKRLWTPAAKADFLAGFAALARTYLAGVDWETRGSLDHRAAWPLLQQPVARLTDISAAWRQGLEP
jgi:hypothetical protein